MYVVVVGLVLGQSLMVISITGIMLYAKVSAIYNVLWECIVIVYTKSTLFTNIWTHECTFGYQSVGVCEVSYTYLLGCLRYREKHVKDVCCCLQTCNSVVYVVYSDGVSTWAKFDGHIYHEYPVICKSISPLLGIMGVHCCYLYVKYIVYKHLNTWVHFGPSKPRCLWSFIYISTRVFEILRETICKRYFN